MISNSYKNLLSEMQSKNRFKGGLQDYDEVFNFIKNENPLSVLDFGCAHGNLIKKLKEDFPKILFAGYDPGVVEYEVFPSNTVDCLISNDVIEHIEPKFLDLTLQEINKLFSKSARLIIACYPAKKDLPDGRNAHLTVENSDWWLEKIKIIFNDCLIENSTIVEKAVGKPELQITLRKN
jgi:cyclopropane fatty-acyl-phospholipid synthase-like methyltransferase